MTTRKNGMTREDLAAMVSANRELFEEKLGRIDDGVKRIAETLDGHVSFTTKRLDIIEIKADDALKFKWKAAGGLGVGGAIVGFASHWLEKLFR